MSKLGRGIYYRKHDKRYVGKCHAGRDENNTLVYAYVYARKYTDVVQKLEEKRLELARFQRIRLFKDGSIATWIFHYLSLCTSEVKPSTKATYFTQANNHIIPAIGKIKVCDLTTQMVQEFIEILSNKGLSAVSVRNVYRLLRAAFNRAEQKNMLFANPCKGIILPEVRTSQVQTLNKEQQSILEKKGDIAVILSLFTGMRIGEICALRIENIDLLSGIIRVDSTMQRVHVENDGRRKTRVMISTPKSKKSNRVIPLNTDVLRLLSKHITAKRGYLLTNSESYIEPRTLQNRFKKLIDEASIPHFNFHALRHTFATRCLENNVDIKTISEILGHANASITLNVYCHSCFEHKKECVNRLKLSTAA